MLQSDGDFRTKLLDAITDYRFDPGWDTAVALGTLLVFWPIFYIGWNVETSSAFVFSTVVGTIFVAVFLPVYYVLVLRAEPLSNLGFTTEGWQRAVGVSVLFVLVTLPAFQFEGYTERFAIPELTIHVVTNGLLLWEPVFVHGWLQIRYEKAFGTVPGILLAGGSFGLYHIGTYPVEGVLALVAFGCVYAVMFRIARWNLLAIWPLTWAVGSGLGTLDGGILFDRIDAVSFLAVLTVTAFGIRWIAQQNPSPDSWS